MTALAWSPDGTRMATAALQRRRPGVGPRHENRGPGHDRPHQRRGWSADEALAHLLFPLFPTASLGMVRWVLKVLAWSPDGSRLAVAGDRDGTVQLWSPLTGAVTVLSGHRRRVTVLAWSPDGTQVATGSTTGRRGSGIRRSGADDLRPDRPQASPSSPSPGRPPETG